MEYTATCGNSRANTTCTRSRLPEGTYLLDPKPLTWTETVPVEGSQLSVILLLLALTTLLSVELPYVLPLNILTLYSEMHFPPSLGKFQERTLQEERVMLLMVPA